MQHTQKLWLQNSKCCSLDSAVFCCLSSSSSSLLCQLMDRQEQEEEEEEDQEWRGSRWCSRRPSARCAASRTDVSTTASEATWPRCTAAVREEGEEEEEEGETAPMDRASESVSLTFNFLLPSAISVFMRGAERLTWSQVGRDIAMRDKG